MRKLILQMQISVDGCVQYGNNDTQEWMTRDWPAMKNEVLGLQNSCDTQLLGRKLAVDFIPFWLDTGKDPNAPMHELATTINRFRKIVFSKTLQRLDYANTEVTTGDLKETVVRLKSEAGKNIMVVGGSSFVSFLIKENLVDDYYLFVNPVVLGNGGIPIFQQLDTFRRMKLIKSTTYVSGIVLHHYTFTNQE